MADHESIIASDLSDPALVQVDLMADTNSSNSQVTQVEETKLNESLVVEKSQEPVHDTTNNIQTAPIVEHNVENRNETEAPSEITNGTRGCEDTVNVDEIFNVIEQITKAESPEDLIAVNSMNVDNVVNEHGDNNDEVIRSSQNVQTSTELRDAAQNDNTFREVTVSAEVWVAQEPTNTSEVQATSEAINTTDPPCVSLTQEATVARIATLDKAANEVQSIPERQDYKDIKAASVVQDPTEHMVKSHFQAVPETKPILHVHANSQLQTAPDVKTASLGTDTVNTQDIASTPAQRSEQPTRVVMKTTKDVLKMVVSDEQKFELLTELVILGHPSNKDVVDAVLSLVCHNFVY